MRRFRFLLGSLVACGLVAGPAAAQTFGPRPERAASANEYYDAYYTSAPTEGATAPANPSSPASPQPPSKGATAQDSLTQADTPTTDKNGKEEGNGKDKKDEKEEEAKDTCRWCHHGKLGEAWKLPQPQCLKDNKINISGWAQSGLYTNAYGAPDNGTLGLNNYNDFNLHQLWFYGERKADTQGECRWDWGGRIDYVFGVDGPDTQCFGDHSWDYGWNSSSRYGSAIPQLYGELAYGLWTVRGGHFYTPHGYEVYSATGNFFFSHSYMFFYGEPFTHTGFTVTRKLNDKVSVYGGWVDGWDSGWENRNGADLFIGGINITFSEKASFNWSFNTGNFGTQHVTPMDGDIFYNCFVFNLKLTDRLTYVFQNDLASNTNIATGSAQWYGISQYLLYKLNDCWSTGGRIEWFRDNDGLRVIDGNRGDYYEATLGLNYKPHSNCLVRPEIRWDWYNGVIGAHAPFNSGLATNQFSGGFDVIFTF